MTARAGRRDGGFTLLEVLVALVVLGLLTVGLAQGVRTGLAMWGAQTRRIERTADLDAVERLLRGLFATVPSPIAARFTGDAALADALAGEAGRVAFTGRMPTGLGTTRRAHMVLERAGGRLVLRWTPAPHETLAGPPPAPRRTVLLDGVRRLAIAYWGRLVPNRPPGWQNRWTGAIPPELIRVRLSFAKGDPRRWPDLVVALQF